MLSRLLVGHKESTLMSLVEIIHDKIQVSLGENVREKLEGLTLTELKIGAWIDPIGKLFIHYGFYVMVLSFRCY